VNVVEGINRLHAWLREVDARAPEPAHARARVDRRRRRRTGLGSAPERRRAMMVSQPQTTLV
jgi:hypothetical protein